MCFSILDPKKETDHSQTLTFEFERKKGLETQSLLEMMSVNSRKANEEEELKALAYILIFVRK